MGLEDSKCREAVTAQTKIAKTNVGSRVQEMTWFENTLQVDDFKASMRLTICNFYPTMSGKGARVYAESSGMFLCVYQRGIYDVCLDFTCLIFDLCLLETPSRGPIQMNSLWPVKSQPEMECLIRLTWDLLYSPDPLHLNWRLKIRKSLIPMLKTSPFDWLSSPIHISPIPNISSTNKNLCNMVRPLGRDVLYICRCIITVLNLFCVTGSDSLFLKWCGKLPGGTLPKRLLLTMANKINTRRSANQGTRCVSRNSRRSCRQGVTHSLGRHDRIQSRHKKARISTSGSNRDKSL